VRELPRVMTIYDVDMPLAEAKSVIMYHFRKHSSLKDGRYDTICVLSSFSIFRGFNSLYKCFFRVIGVLLAKGYMELEETLMQWKQKTHLMRILEVRSPFSFKQFSLKDLIFSFTHFFT
jgi:NADH dehydrogenase (ubiquinone) 1 alpha subcomplex subunit 6